MLSPESIVLWTALTAFATISAAAVAALYTYFTARLLRAQSEPRVIVFARHDSDRPTMLVIRIENIGRDIAHDVTFRSSRPIPHRAFGLDEKTLEPPKVMTDGPLIEGIPALGPGDYREITWGQPFGLLKALGDNTVMLTYMYRHGRRTFTGSASLDVRSHLWIDISERPPLRTARGVESIADSLKSIDRRLAHLADVLRERTRDAPPDSMS